MKEQISFFVSYSHKDRPLAQKLAAELGLRGCKVWIDEGELRVGDSIIERISSAINEVDFVVALLSKSSVKSSWCHKELSIAITGGLEKRGVKVLPCKIGNVKIPAPLTDLLYLEINTQDISDAAVKLIADARSHLGIFNSDINPVKNNHILIRESIYNENDDHNLHFEEASQKNEIANTKRSLDTASNQYAPIEFIAKHDIDHTNSIDISSFFVKGGAINKHLGESYNMREGQLSMALTIQDAINHEQHVIIEAGTGIGKSFAYLISVICSGKQAIISTANKALQDQLWEKDIPLIKEIVNRSFKSAIIKGRSNYVCFAKCARHCDPEVNFSSNDGFIASSQIEYEGYKEYPSLNDLYERVNNGQCKNPNQQLAQILSKILHDQTGDVDLLRLSKEERELFTTETQEECSGSHRRPIECFYDRAIQEAEDADIVVMNHAVLAQLIASGWERLSHRDVLIIDEAHDFERFFLSLLRHTLHQDDIPNLMTSVSSALKTTQTYIQSLKRSRFLLTEISEVELERVDELNKNLFNTVTAYSTETNENSWPFSVDAGMIAKDISQELQNILNQLNLQITNLKSHKQPARERIIDNYEFILGRFSKLIDLLNNLAIIGATENLKYCMTDNEQKVVISHEPFDASSFLSTNLWGGFKSVVALSATITIKGKFDYFRTKHGAPTGVNELIINSPFNYEKQALLYTPYGLFPRFDDNEPEYVQQLANEIERLIIASRGRALVLCTSWKRAEQLHYMLEDHLPFDLYKQGQSPPNELVEKFKSSEKGAVIFATRSFWQGVDIPGEKLSLVVIDKLPFFSKDDFTVNERCNNIRKKGGNPFMDYILAEAILTLKQGVGRLIRNETDRGVIAILDSRINQANYAKRIIASLPSAKRSFYFEEVKSFFN